jgi:DNA-binding transcriptional ArsR family regulator
METVPSSELPIQTLELKRGQQLFKAINHKLRMQLLHSIHEKGRITVTELYIKHRVEQSVVSQHLAVLRKGGFVKTEREGKFVYYCLNLDRIREVERFADVLNTVR